MIKYLLLALILLLAQAELVFVPTSGSSNGNPDGPQCEAMVMDSGLPYTEGGSWQECKDLCAGLEGCQGVVYKGSNDRCWPKGPDCDTMKTCETSCDSKKGAIYIDTDESVEFCEQTVFGADLTCNSDHSTGQMLKNDATLQDCKDYCSQEPTCEYFYKNSNGNCFSYSQCGMEDARVPSNSGKTFKKGECPVDCNGEVWGQAVEDECGVCGGDSTTCMDCAGVPNGDSELDECDVCGGDGSSCAEEGGSHWVIKGHSGTGCNEPDGCDPYMADDSEIHKVRCCSDIEIDGWTTHCGIWHTSQGCESLNFMDAEAHCEGLGGRLCTKEEVENNCAIGDGCNHDNYLIWTSDPQDEDVGFAAGFPASFEALGATMTCASSTTGSDGMGDYVQCDGFQVNGMYGPNGITCGPTWSTTESSYTSYASLCQGLGFTGGFQVYYECEASTTRYSFDGYGWSTTGDNGYVKNIKCYGYVAPEPDCAGVVGGDAVVDQCGVCGGDSSTCADCAGVPNGNAALDECGVCNGDGSSCADCAGVPNGNAVEDECGVCEGSGGPCGYGNGFPPSFEALGASMTCASSSTGSDGMGDYVQCDGFQVNGMYGPNGITCGPTWSTTESSYTSYASLCQGLGFTGGFSVYYECEASTTRYSFDGYGWSTTGDNGYVKNIKCYGYVAPETTSAPTTTAEPTTTTAEPTTTTAEPTTTTAEPTTTTAEPTTTAAPECTDFTEKKPCKKAKKTHPPLKCTWHKSINQCQADDWEPVCSEFTEKKPCKKMGCTWDKKTSSCGGEEECIMAWGEVAELVTMNGKVKHKNIDSAEDCVDLAVSLGGMGIEYDETSSKGLCWTYTKVKEFVEGSSSDGMTVLVNKCS